MNSLQKIVREKKENKNVWGILIQHCIAYTVISPEVKWNASICFHKTALQTSTNILKIPRCKKERKKKNTRLIAQRALFAFCMHKGPTYQILAEVFSETEPNSAKVHQYTRPVRRLHAADFLHDLQLTLLSHPVLPFGWRTLIGWGGYSQAVTCSCEGSVNGPRARSGGGCKQVERRQFWPGGGSRIHAHSHTHTYA